MIFYAIQNYKKKKKRVSDLIILRYINVHISIKINKKINQMNFTKQNRKITTRT